MGKIAPGWGLVIRKANHVIRGLEPSAPIPFHVQRGEKDLRLSSVMNN